MASHKIERIESDIQKYLGNIILTETRDEIFKDVTITGVKVSKDLYYCKVYFTSMNELSHKEMESKLNDASSYLRGCLAKVIEIRNIPELKFVYDESIEYANRIESIISEINND